MTPANTKRPGRPKLAVCHVIPIPKGFVPTRATYTIKEAAKYLGVAQITIRRLIQRKLLRTCKALSKILIPGADVETFMERTSS